MNDIPIRQFKDFCKVEGLHTFCYETENQDENSIDRNIRTQLSFCDIRIYYNPNSICLSGENGFMKLEPVKKVIVDEIESVLGRVVTIVCGTPGSANKFDKSYRFLLT